MSRCFPFPPPGYEKKARADDDSLLAKEKHKEKKRKKDKKDREKREGKEKKDREKSEEKHKEKRHKGKKDKHRVKETRGTSDDKNTLGPPEGHNGEKLSSNCIQSNDTNEFKFLLELGKRIRDDDRATENRMVQRITLTGQRTAQFPAKVVGGSTANMVEESEKVKENIYGQNNKVDAKDMENGVIKKNFIVGDQRKIKSVAGLVDESVDKRMEEKEKDKHKNSGSRGERHKDKDREEKNKLKDKKREKKDKKEKKEKGKRKVKESNKKQLEPRENAVNVPSIKPSPPLNESTTSAVNEGILGKRKELKLNGFLHDDAIRPNKLPRSVSSLHEVLENGTKMEPLKNATQFVPKWEGAVDKDKMNNNMVSSFHPNTENGRKMKLCQVPSSHLVVENGRKLERSQISAQLASGKQGAVGNHTVNNVVSFFHPVVKNGRKSELSQTPAQLASGKQGAVGNHTVDNVVSFSHPVVKNGRKSEPSQTPAQLASGKQGAVGNHTVDDAISFSHPVIKNGRKSEPSQAPAQLTSGKLGAVGNHTVDDAISFSHAVVKNGRKLEPRQSSAQLASGKQGVVGNHAVDNVVSFSQPVVENGKKLEPTQTAAQLTSGKQGVVGNHAADKSISFSQPVQENGRKLQTSQTEAQLAFGRPGLVKVINKENGVNVKASAPVQVKESVKASAKPPHPDSKYLSKIFSVPKIVWDEFDDQEWLYGCSDIRKEKSSVGAEGPEQVWAEALKVESADVTALPYVIPY